jgi:hypothetical protein
MGWEGVKESAAQNKRKQKKKQHSFFKSIFCISPFLNSQLMTVKMNRFFTASSHRKKLKSSGRPMQKSAALAPKT